MATISLRLSTRQDARGKSEILLRFVAGRDHLYRIKTDLYIDPSKWNASEQRIIIRKLGTPEQRELLRLKDRLDGLCTFLLDEFAEADKSVVNSAWMQEAVARYHHPERNESMQFFSAFDKFISTRPLSEGRRKHYQVVMRDMQRFEAYRGIRLTLSNVTADTLAEFEHFLTIEHTLPYKKKWAHLYAGMTTKELPEQRGPNTVGNIMSKVRAFFRDCVNNGIAEHNPFDRYKITAGVYGTPYYLTIEERDRIYRTNLCRHPQLEVQRDIFIFQCFTGPRVGDMLRFRKSDIVDGVLEYIPNKTKGGSIGVVRVPLTSTAREIVARYSWMRGDKLLPFLSAEKYNDALKLIFRAARINRAVSVLDPLTRQEVKKPLYEVASSHLARRTFIGNLYKKVKDQNLVSAMSGHADGSRAFARYRTIDEEMRRDTVNLLEEE